MCVVVFLLIECFHMASRRPYWCPKTIKRRPFWCLKPILWQLNSLLMQTLSFVPINLHRCWPPEWKHSIKPKGHFRVPPGPCFKTRVDAQPLIWKSFFIFMQIKLGIFTRNDEHPSLVLKGKVFGTRKWPFVFSLTFSLPSASLDFKVPNIFLSSVLRENGSGI